MINVMGQYLPFCLDLQLHLKMFYHHTEFLEFGRRFLILIARKRFVVLSFNR